MNRISIITNDIASNMTKYTNQKNQLTKQWKRCKLDEDNCINLDSVLETFNSSISEEQAWSICFGFVNCIQNLTRKGVKFRNQPFKTNNNSNQNEFIIYLHKDGYIHEKTIFQPFNESNQFKDEFELNEQELLMRLGLALFDALDYKKDSNEELLISKDLENLIGKMTLEGPNGFFEFTSEEIYEICCSRKASQIEDKTVDHYTNICKILVIETIELSTFLQTIYVGTQQREKMFNNSRKQDCTDSLDNGKLSNDEPLKLHLAQWAKLWMLVLDEFRNGKRKLRKVEQTDKLDKLDRTTNNNGLNTLDRTNAHALIMEYIRSRPALMPATNRKLKPSSKPSSQSLIEQIHESIRKQDVKLKPVHLNPRNSLFAPVVGRVVDNADVKLECNSENSSPMIRKKLIKADIDYIDWDNDDLGGRNIKYSSLF